MDDSVTFFTIPHSFEGLHAIHQTNAIRSWLALGQPIILFGQGKEFAAQHGCVSASVGYNTWKTPYIHDAFWQAQERIKGLAVFINTDIILPNDALIKAMRLAAENFEKFLVIGCRTDINFDAPLDFNGDWRAVIHSLAGNLHGMWGVDYLGFKSRLWWEIPPFAVGRMRWDGWLVAEAARLGAQLIDATQVVTVYHQNHGYEHVGGPLTVENQEVRENYVLAGGQILGVHHTHWILDKDGLKKR